MNCEFCHKPTHIWFECKDKPAGWRPARLSEKSTATGNDRSRLSSLSTVPDALWSGRSREDKASPQSVAAAVVPPVETNLGPKGRDLVKGRGRLATSQQGQDALPPIQSAAQAGGKFDKAAWMRANMPAYMRQYRADIKAGIRIPKAKGK